MKPVNLSISQLHPGSNYFCIGLPLPKGVVTQCNKLAVYDHADEIVHSVVTPTALWPDSSIKWCLVKVALQNQTSASTKLTIRQSDNPSFPALVTAEENENNIAIHSGPAIFSFNKDDKSALPARRSSPLMAVS